MGGEQVSHSKILTECLLRVSTMQQSRLWRCMSQYPCPQDAHSLVEGEDV